MEKHFNIKFLDCPPTNAEFQAMFLPEDETFCMGVGEITEIVENDYNKLINKPSIESHVLIGDQSFADLGMTAMSNMDIDNLLTI